MALIFEAGSQTYFDNRQIVFCQQFFGAFDALLHQILLRRKAGCAPKSAGKMKLTQIGDFRECGKRQIFFQIFVDKFFDAAQFIARKSAIQMFLNRIAVE